jgi:TonB-dependent receptor
MRSLHLTSKSIRRSARAIALAGIALPAFAQAQDHLEAQDGQEIIVSGSRASREQAIERKRELPVVADVIASDDIGKLPDFNTAEAMQRLPGVSVQLDQGEPRYVVVRGVDPNLNQVTVDGNVVGIPEAEGRRVALDTIPSDLVAAIEVVKAVTPDYDANAIGGSINLVTPTAFDKPTPFTYGTLRGAYNEKSGKVGFGASFTHGRRFGPNEEFGIVVAASYLKRFIDSDLVEPTGWSQFGTVSAPTNLVLFDYRIMRERIGGIVNLDWRPTDDMRLYIRSIYNQFTDHEERDQFNFAYAAGTPTFPTATSIRFPNGRATRQFRQNNQTQKLYNISPGAEFRFGDAELDLNYTFAHAQEHTPVRDDLEFRSAAGQVTVLELSPGLPYFTTIPDAMYDPAAFPLRRIRQRREWIEETLHTARADLKLPFDDAGSFFKTGAKFISRVKKRDNTQTQSLAVGSSTFAQTGAVLPEPEDFYDGAYAFGPAMDYRKVLDYYAANPGLLMVDTAQTRINEYALDYNIRENIYAGYGMASLQFGDLTAIGGVRVEKTEGTYRAFSIRNGGATITPLSYKQSYTHVLPSVHLNYRPSTDFTLRAAWTNTIGRPNYDASVPTFTEDAGNGSAGNPNLKPYTSMGLDLSAEFYPDSDTIYSVGLFYKHLKNPIFTQTIFNTSFAGVPLLSLSQPQNASTGKLYGIEINLQRRFTFLPAPLDGFGASVNGTYIKSDVNVPTRPGEDLPFFRQSKKILNAALFYESGPFEARVAVSYRDRFLEAIADTALQDVYQGARTAVDARVSYQVSSAIEIFGSLSNITKASNSFYQGNVNQTYSREIYSFNGDFGISLRF